MSYIKLGTITTTTHGHSLSPSYEHNKHSKTWTILRTQQYILLSLFFQANLILQY